MNSYKGIYVYPLLFVSLWHRGNGNHKMRTGAVPLKIRNTLQWDSLFLESSIMIDDRMNKKWRKLFGALFNKLCLTALTYIHNVVRYDGWICCLLRQPIKLRWTSFFLKSSIMIDDRWYKKRMKFIGALFDKLCLFEFSLSNKVLLLLLLLLFVVLVVVVSWPIRTYSCKYG